MTRRDNILLSFSLPDVIFFFFYLFIIINSQCVYWMGFEVCCELYSVGVKNVIFADTGTKDQVVSMLQFYFYCNLRRTVCRPRLEKKTLGRTSRQMFLPLNLKPFRVIFCDQEVLLKKCANSEHETSNHQQNHGRTSWCIEKLW